MPSLIPDADKLVLEETLNDVFDTFKRPFTVYKEANKVILYSGTNYAYSRFGQNDQNVDEITNAPQPFIIYGCILHEKKQFYQFFSTNKGDDTEIKLKMASGKVRLKVDEAGFEILKDMKLAVVDNMDYRIASTPSPHGLFGVKRYTFLLERIQ